MSVLNVEPSFLMFIKNMKLFIKLDPANLAWHAFIRDRCYATTRSCELTSENLSISSNDLRVSVLRDAVFVNACSKRLSIKADAIHNFNVA